MNLRPLVLRGAVDSAEKDKVFDQLFGFFDVKVLMVALHTGVFRALEGGPKTVPQLSEACRLPERSLRFILLALNSMDLVTEERGAFGATPLAQKFYFDASACFQGPYALLASWVMDAMPQMLAGMQENRPIWDGFSHYVKDGEDKVSAQAREQLVNESMAASQLWVSQALLRHLDLAGARRMLDIGGGYGRFAATAAKVYPSLEVTVLELPQVCEAAASQLSAWGVSERVKLVPGDFVNDPFPPGHDVIAFIRIFNSRSNETIQRLLNRAFEALEPGGKVIVCSAPILDAGAKRQPRQSVRLALLHWAASLGEPHYLHEYAERLVRAGFQAPHVSLVDDPYGLLVATKA